MYHWRVTKYNPSNRNSQGHYLKDEWTCPSEIGKVFDGKQFTLEEYLNVENAYVATVFSFIKEIGLDLVRVINPTKLLSNNNDRLFEPKFEQIHLYEDQLIDISLVPDICRMVLRNIIGCKLVRKDKFYVHFGWDYYMYIGSMLPSEETIRLAKSNGLYVEEDVSPYLFSGGIPTLSWSKKDDFIIHEEEQLDGLSLEEIRTLLCLSEDHPMTGHFVIMEQRINQLQQKATHIIDTEKFDYFISCE
ncbi:DUF7683 domain-containing protein [Saccharibacillus kuerlensis]|uniref:DUF7683 domain-containing protein n=1 Tax=Saccharibacillus kuerlensis TaxID=459527 RepID=A0ABQ2L7C7_9BACL|nr:hypothetical protein [Saccharibacillus kuerlensis]GGO05872.1 hypothetical protein GCM10010969_32670 [Saccharibacillus kuerlensis]